MIDRRELIQRVGAMMGGALSSGAVAGILSGCVSTPQPQGKAAAPPRFFTAEEQAKVTVLAEQIIPRTDTPGAIDLGVPAFIDRMMADFYMPNVQGIVRTGLVRVDTDAQTKYGKAFVALTSDQQVELMKVWDAEQVETGRRQPPTDPHFFRFVKELTTLGFFTTEIGATKILRYDPTPGPYRGDMPVGKTWVT